MPPAATSRRRFKSPYWDVPPTGFEHVTPRKYKDMQAAGQVPQSVVNPSSQHLQGTKYAHPRPADPMEAVRAAAAVINAQLGIKSTGVSGGKSSAPATTRQARRLYVGNIPFGCTDDEMIEFFRANMDACSFIKEPGNPVLACQINLDKNFAFLEFRTVEETSSAMALDGINCKGQALKIRRPHDYQPIPGSEPTPAPISGVLGSRDSSSHRATGSDPSSRVPGFISTVVADSPNKIYIGGIPTYVTDDQIRDILASFGQLRAFNLIKDPATQASKGYAFCEYLEPSDTDRAILGLNGFEVGDKRLVVQRASVGAKSGTLSGSAVGANATGSAANNTLGVPKNVSATFITGHAPVQIQVPGLPPVLPSSTPRVLTEVLCLMNMFDPAELKDDETYEEILEDIEEECKKFGSVRSIHIPRPRPDGDEDVPGLGKVYIEFESVTEAQRAQTNLAGRVFGQRTTITQYFDRDRYRNKEF